MEENQEQFEFEKQKLELEKQKFEFERQKMEFKKQQLSNVSAPVKYENSRSPLKRLIFVFIGLIIFLFLIGKIINNSNKPSFKSNFNISTESKPYENNNHSSRISVEEQARKDLLEMGKKSNYGSTADCYGKETCPMCVGNGKTKDMETAILTGQTKYNTCSTCRGKGYICH
jgi:hypothetical protein